MTGIKLDRIYFSAYQRGLGEKDLPGEHSVCSNNDLLMREHRLYQVDWLIRKYGFQEGEILFNEKGKPEERLEHQFYLAVRQTG